MTSVDYISLFGALLGLLFVFSIGSLAITGILTKYHLITKTQASSIDKVVDGMLHDIDTVISPTDSGTIARDKVVKYLQSKSSSNVDTKKAQLQKLKAQIKEAKKGF